MDRRKISTDLFMAINIPESVRENTLDLNVGFDDYFDEWEVIIRYTGSLDNIREELNISIEELLGGYAIARIPQFLIPVLSEYPEIDYIEKPKELLINSMNGVDASCVSRVRLPDYNLTGRGTLVACLDSGVDIYHPDFQNDNDTTRIERIWDQTVFGNPPSGFQTGSLYTAEDINNAISAELQRISIRSGGIDGRELRDSTVFGGRDIVPVFDSTGHGTAVLGIIAGNGRASGGRNAGMAPEAGIVVVKLGNPDDRGFPRTTQLMLAVDYSIRYAISVGKPIAINISFGNNYGAHNGESILERYLDEVANQYRTSIIVGVGNEGITSRHASGRLRMGSTEIIEIIAGDYLRSFNLQIWKNYQDDFDVIVETPFGREIGPFSDLASVLTYTSMDNVVAAYYGMPTPYNPKQEIYISFSSDRDYVTPGIWRIYLRSKRIVSGEYDMWLPVAGSTSAEVSFTRPDIYNTITIPSSGRYVISVAAYDSRNDTHAAFSGRGVDLVNGGVSYTEKPDISAPGVSINSTSVGGGYGDFTGTSFAAPFVTGAASLLMQYGIVDGNDRYIYGEKLRAMLIRGARPLTSQQFFPSPLIGWGALCVSDSI